MGVMAQRGRAALDTANQDAPNSHAKFLKACEVIPDDIRLAVLFGISIPTVRKWRNLPLGYTPGLHGRRNKKGVRSDHQIAP